MRDAEQVEVKAPPEPVLVMMRAKETVDGELFNLGEVLVSSCEVLLSGEPGWATVPGDEPERALSAAVLDAANHSGAIPEDLREELALLLAFAREDRRVRWAKVQPSRVEFEEMT